jgi:hypothetical protein
MIATGSVRSSVRRHPSRVARLLLGSVFVALLLVTAVGLAGYVWPSDDERTSTSLGSIDDLAVGVPVSFWVSDGRVLLEPWPDWDVRGYLVLQPDGTPLAFEARDPLEGCPLVWTAGADRFSDSCHKNDYWLDGRPVEPISAVILRQFAVTIASDGRILVDVGGGPR